jgi:hypothetical protein
MLLIIAIVIMWLSFKTADGINLCPEVWIDEKIDPKI